MKPIQWKIYHVEIVRAGVFFDSIEYLTIEASSWNNAMADGKALLGRNEKVLNVRRIR